MAAKTPATARRGWLGKQWEKLWVLVAFWVLLAAFVAVLVAGLVVSYFWVHPDPSWLSTVPSQSTAPAEPPITLAEADPMTKIIQSALLIVGFLGVTATAVITYRRQRTTENNHALEREKFQAERDHDAAQRQLERDKFEEGRATERVRREEERARIDGDRAIEAERSRQERYAQGAQMLAHESTSIRIAGLNVICQLGREVAAEDPWRQTCVNLICSYLRSPPSPPSQPATAVTKLVDGRRHNRIRTNTNTNTATDVYLVVTEEACRLLPTLLAQVPDPKHLADRPETGIGKPASHPLDLDLRGATLTTLDMSRRRIGKVTFGDTQFSGDAGFGGVQFSGAAWFGGVQFSGAAWFDRVQFSGAARFDAAQFTGAARFDAAQFTGAARFDAAQFSGAARFDAAQFSGAARFDAAQFRGAAWFGGAQFSGDVGFDRVRFTGAAWFRGAQFSGDAGFRGARLTGAARFDAAQFTGAARFDAAKFTGAARFDAAQFRGAARFDAAQFHEDPWFYEEQFAVPPTGLLPEWIQPSQ